MALEKTMPLAVKKYIAITANYWAFTLTDGALRMLILFYFYQQGYSPIELAGLFIFYEVFGVITNLVGGWLGARIGLNKTMLLGVTIQLLALVMLTVPASFLSVSYVMCVQALSGIAKDLNKMSAKSSIKLLVATVHKEEKKGKLFRWVALLTGSKNTLKGVGFFVGGLLLNYLGFQYAVLTMACGLLVTALLTSPLLKKDIGKSQFKAKFTQLFSTNAHLNNLAAARLCLFAARDVWFVIALPVYLVSQVDWLQQEVGSFLACWIIFYGIIQANAPRLLSFLGGNEVRTAAKQAQCWALTLAYVTLILCLNLHIFSNNYLLLISSLFVFAAVFAINSSLHSFLIVDLAREDGVSLDVGFYYMANALGRLIGTVMSGYLYQQFGLLVCLVMALIFTLLARYFVQKVP